MNNEERELDLALAEAEQENRLLRARNERLMIEAQLTAQKVADYEGLIRDLTEALRAASLTASIEEHDVCKDCGMPYCECDEYE